MNERPACLELVARNPNTNQLQIFNEKKENNLVTVKTLGYIGTFYILCQLRSFPLNHMSNWHSIYLNECNYYCPAGVHPEANRVFNLDIEDQKKDYDMFVAHCMDAQSEFLKKHHLFDYDGKFSCCESPF